MSKSRLFRGVLLLLALVLCLTCVMPEGKRAAAEEEAEIVGSYPYTTVTRVKVNLRASRSVKSALLKRIPEKAVNGVFERDRGTDPDLSEDSMESSSIPL